MSNIIPIVRLDVGDRRRATRAQRRRRVLVVVAGLVLAGFVWSAVIVAAWLAK